MTKTLLSLLLAFVLMGQDCEPLPPPEGGNAYCAGNNYSIWDGIPYGWEQDGVAGAYSAILNGIPSNDRRSTVQVRFGQAFCSGVVLDSRTVLTAAHCGYGATTAHGVYFPTPIPNSDFVDLGRAYTVDSHTVHPDYLRYVSSGNTDLEARKADLMVLSTAETLPGPYVGYGFYTQGLSPVCQGLVAQGLGKWESGGLSLREGRYIITSQTDKYLMSRRESTETKICYGDSGGPLYADVAGIPRLAGITSTTMSRDCRIGGTHVNVAFFRDWIVATAAAGKTG